MTLNVKRDGNVVAKVHDGILIECSDVAIKEMFNKGFMIRTGGNKNDSHWVGNRKCPVALTNIGAFINTLENEGYVVEEQN
jgi:hypothetical protein